MLNITQSDIKDILGLLKQGINLEDWGSVEEAKEYLEEFIEDKFELE